MAATATLAYFLRSNATLRAREMNMQRVPTRTELLQVLPTGSVGAELGVLDGAFSEEILRIVRPSLLYLVDLFVDGTRLMREDSSGQWKAYEPSGLEAWRTVRSRFASEIASGQVQIVCAEACGWLTSAPPSSLDWLYLDDDHTYEHVAQELELAVRCIKPGGWILGHDYCDVLPGVPQAVDEFCATRNLEIGFLTDENPLPVYPRPPGYPATSCYNSFAIRMPPAA